MRFIITFALFFAFNFTKAATYTPEKYVICKNLKIVRTIRVEKTTTDGQCNTTYTKAGIDRIIGSGKSMSGCQAILDNVKGNLEEAHWKCREISKVKINKLKSSEE